MASRSGRADFIVHIALISTSGRNYTLTMGTDNQIGQQGNSSNNSIVVNYGSGNTTSVHQKLSPFRDDAAVLCIDPSSIERVSSADVTSSATTSMLAVLGLSV